MYLFINTSYKKTMTYTHNEILDIMKNERYPLSLKYDPDWILENSMGSHNLWLQEALSQDMSLKQGMRTLDLGCGKAISSIFLAKEFGLKVWATDLWIGATDNYKRICEAGLNEQVFPMHSDASDLPYAEGFFDALMSVNALFFFIDNGEQLKEKVLKYVKTGGQVGVIIPGFLKEYKNGVPEELKPHWDKQLDKWHTLEWWINCFNESGIADIQIADTLPDNEGNTIYRKSAMMVNAHEEPFNAIAGENITFIRIIAKIKEK